MTLPCGKLVKANIRFHKIQWLADIYNLVNTQPKGLRKIILHSGKKKTIPWKLGKIVPPYENAEDISS